MSRRRGVRATAPPPVDLDNLMSDEPIPNSTPAQTGSPNAPPAGRGRARNRSSKAIEPDPTLIADTVEENAPTSKQGKVYTAAEVENLPKKLEEQISKLHSEIAQTLIERSNTLMKASDDLFNIHTSIINSMKSIHESCSQESDVYNSLSDISSNHEVSATLIKNKKLVINQVQEIMKQAEVPESWGRILSQGKFSSSNIEEIQRTLLEATNALKPENMPPLLKGLSVGADRNNTINTLLKSFVQKFCKFFDSFMDNSTEIESESAAASDPVNIPRTDLTKKPVPFSYENVKKHTVLRAIYVYSSIILWIRNYDSNAHDMLIMAYQKSATRHTSKLVSDVYQKYALELTKIKRPEVPVGLFTAGECMKSDQAKVITKLMSQATDELFDILRCEKTVLQEFWGLADGASQLNQLFCPNDVNMIYQLWEYAFNYDLFFTMRGYSLNEHLCTQYGIPTSNIINPFQNRWRKFLDDQISLVKADKYKTNKTSTLGPIKLFPNFLIHLSRFKEDFDTEILVQGMDSILDQLILWITEDVSPKFSKSKRARVVAVNINYLLTKLKDRSLVKESELLQQRLQRAGEVMAEQIQELLRVLVRDIWKRAVQYFDQVRAWKDDCDLTDEMVSFQPTHTDDKFAELRADIMKRLPTSVNECQAYLKEKIKDEELRAEIRRAMLPYVTDTFTGWSEMATACYGGEGLQDELKELQKMIAMQK